MKFTPGQLGGYAASGPAKIWVYVNGEAVTDGPGYVLKRHDNIVVAYGSQGSFPTQPPADALNGL